MSQQAIQEYVPLCEVVTYKGEKYYIKAESKKRFMEDLEKFKFVHIGEVSLASLSIEFVRPATQNVSILERMISKLPEEIKIKVRQEVEKRKKDGLKCEPVNISNIIEYFTNGKQ